MCCAVSQCSAPRTTTPTNNHTYAAACCNGISQSSARESRLRRIRRRKDAKATLPPATPKHNTGNRLHGQSEPSLVVPPLQGALAKCLRQNPCCQCLFSASNTNHRTAELGSVLRPFLWAHVVSGTVVAPCGTTATADLLLFDGPRRVPIVWLIHTVEGLLLLLASCRSPHIDVVKLTSCAALGVVLQLCKAAHMVASGGTEVLRFFKCRLHLAMAGSLR